ncbi:hypothetical protein V8C86DRAFT_2959432 [Haematococcus lacustris]
MEQHEQLRQQGQQLAGRDWGVVRQQLQAGRLAAAAYPPPPTRLALTPQSPSAVPPSPHPPAAAPPSSPRMGSHPASHSTPHAAASVLVSPATAGPLAAGGVQQATRWQTVVHGVQGPPPPAPGAAAGTTGAGGGGGRVSPLSTAGEKPGCSPASEGLTAAQVHRAFRQLSGALSVSAWALHMRAGLQASDSLQPKPLDFYRKRAATRASQDIRDKQQRQPAGSKANR